MRVAIPIVVFLAAFLAFLPALQNDFVDWDDDVLFVNNLNYRGLGIDQITWMFTNAKLGHYQPATWLTHGLDYCLWGMNPFGYHLSSLIYHAACAVLVYFLALRLFHFAFRMEFTQRGGQTDLSHTSFPVSQTNPVNLVHSSLCLAAAFAALLFAIHPLRVESVAWITERRDLVCTLFLIPSVLCYFRYVTGPGDPLVWYIASLTLFALSLLSKAWGITLPVLLLVLDIYPIRRFPINRVFRSGQRVDTPIPRSAFPIPNSSLNPKSEIRSPKLTSLRTILLDKLPFVLLAFLAAKMAADVQAFAGMTSLAAHPPLHRIAQAFYGLVFYLAKTVLPIRLSPLYELPRPLDPFAPRFLLAAAVLVLLLTVTWRLRRRLPAMAVAFVTYAIILSPVLGFTQTGRQLVADRYSYVACIPFALLAAAGWESLLRRFPLPSAFRVPLFGFLPLLVLVLLSVLTWKQCRVWRNTSTLWNHAIALDPDSRSARNSLGILLVRQQRFSEAAPLFQYCVDLEPQDPLFLCNLASTWKELNDRESARRLYLRALEVRPRSIDTLLRIAQGFFDLSDDRHSLEAAGRAIATDPDDPRAHYAAGQALSRLGNVPAAIPYFRKTIELLEPMLLSQTLDPHTDLRAGLYANACAILSDYFEKHRDFEQAAIYRDKFLRLRGL